MTKKMVDVKSKGVVLGQVEVPVYASMEELLKGENMTKDTALAIVNKSLSDSITNAFRASKVKPSSAMTQLGRIAKSNENAAAEIEALIKKYGG